MLKALRNTGIALLAMVALSGTVEAADMSKQVEARQSVMKLYGFYMGQLAGMAKGKMEYDAKTAEGAAKGMLALATLDSSKMWPPGSGNDALGDKTRAKPEIWSTYPKVAEKSKDLVMALNGFVNVAGTGLDALRSQIGNVGKTCGGCHKPFREKK